MYSVSAWNFIGNATFDENYLEYAFAEQMFNTAKSCVDCKGAFLCDATTGEIILEWNGVTKEFTEYIR